MTIMCGMLVVFLILEWKTRRWLLALVCNTQGFGPDLTMKDHDTAHDIITRLWLAHSILYCTWYFGKLAKLCVYGFMFMVSSTSGTKGNGPT